MTSANSRLGLGQDNHGYVIEDKVDNDWSCGREKNGYECYEDGTEINT